jgi:hypothetical protein
MICRADDLPLLINTDVPTGPIPQDAVRMLAAMLVDAVLAEQDHQPEADADAPPEAKK